MQHLKASVLSILPWLLCPSAYAPAADPPAPASPTAQTKTGELDLTFTQRSPLSDRKELARRLGLKAADMGEDYDLAQRPFKVYVPHNYDPAVPHGVFVYLGYKDSISVATLWEPALDKAHMIFITPVAHHGLAYPNSVPQWQTAGMALDAVHNLKQLYNINDKRLLLMCITGNSIQVVMACSDVFTGLIEALDRGYCERMVNMRTKWYVPPRFPPPPAALFQQAKRRAFVLIDEDFSDENAPPQLTLTTMKREGFRHLLPLKLTTGGDLHYPAFKVEWFEQQLLPFIDSVTAEPKAPPAAEKPAEAAPPTSSKPPATTSPPAAARSAEAEHLLKLGQLYIKNRQTKLAREKLEAILRLYPNDPSAATAKQLLEQLPK